MHSYLEIEKLFGTPLSRIPVARPGLSGLQIFGIIIVGGFAIYGAYKLFQETPNTTENAKAKGVTSNSCKKT